MMTKSRIGTILLVVAAVLLIGYLFVRNNRLANIVRQNEQQLALQEAYEDSLRTTYDERTQSWNSERKAYVAEREVLERFLEEREKELAALRDKGAETGGIIEGETKIDTVIVSKVLPDSTTRLATIDRLPHYQAEITSTPDSTRLKLMAYTNLSYDITDGVMNINHSNPYLTITNAKGFYVLPKPKKSRFWLGVGIGVGVAAGGFFLLN